MADPAQDSVYQYIVNVYPPFLNLQERTLERGTSFDWRELTIDKAGTYERVYKTTEGQCDSIYRLIVREPLPAYSPGGILNTFAVPLTIYRQQLVFIVYCVDYQGI